MSCVRNKIVAWVALVAICLGLFTFPEKNLAADQTVKVTLPKFEVKLNGHIVENQYREYPLLVYKDITYFPMTWYDSRLLGLETEWTKIDGLKIAKSNVTSSYMPYKSSRKNPSSVTATISTSKITINGKSVDNSKEEYPLLSYNNVRYFPLTWKFAHDEFGWAYTWNSSEGLSIKSTNPQLKAVNLPAYAGENDIAMFEGYYYFTETVGSTNQVYRVPVGKTSSKELVYSYALDTSYMNNALRFEIRDNELWFIYHMGGATMGSDVYGKISEDGKAIIEHDGYLDFRDTPYGTLIIDQFVPPSGNNLRMVPAGQDDRQGTSVGNPDLIYGWHITNEGTSLSFNSERSTTIIGEDVFVLASSYPVGTGDSNNIYKINLKNNETERIIKAKVSNFKVLKNKLYYVKDADQYLYSSSLDGTNEQQLSTNKAAYWYGEIDGIVYYTVANTLGTFNLYKSVPSKEDMLVVYEPLESVQFEGANLICKLAEGEDYGVMILDKSGNHYLSVTGPVSNVIAYQDTVLVVTKKDRSVFELVIIVTKK